MKRIEIVLTLAEFITTLAYDDLSYNKDASQSHTFPGTGYGAELAVDGNTATCTRTDVIGPNSPCKTVWWKVDLGGVYNIYSVNILFRNYDRFESRQRSRFAGFSLYVSNTGDRESSSLCYKGGLELPPLNFTTKCTFSGRYVIFYNERIDGVTYQGYEVETNVLTELCEVTIIGCSKPGIYGTNCSIPCPNNCRYNTCHTENGTCFGCKSGYQGPFCHTECPGGWYGLDCKQQCSEHCRDSVSCNHVTGRCDVGCAAGWNGSYCEEVCPDGLFGFDCINNCSGHCLDVSPCNKYTGYCERGCDPGYTNAFCTKKCYSGTFGKGCSNKCSGNCLNNETCDHINGTCTGGCQDGYIGKSCNFSCESGFYGKNCSHTCSLNCKTCQPNDGTCSCVSGWMGPNCSNACNRSYGENCRNPCSSFCMNQTCNRFDGTCLINHADNFEYPKTDVYIAGMSVSVGLNALLIATLVVLLWRYCIKVHPISFRSCWESQLYEKTEHTGGQESTYQELDLKENTYRNTTLTEK